MNNKKFLQHSPKYLLIALLSAAVLAGCASDKKCCTKPEAAVASPVAPVAPPVVAPTPALVAPAVVATVMSVIRINAGSDANITDADGNIWLADRGFDGGDSAPRDADLKIENTKDAALYRTEHWGMSSFSQALPNGKYVVKLHFAETWEGVSGPGERVFSFNVEGQEFRDFDVYVKAGGRQRAYIETVNVAVTDGKLDITFEPNVDNPEINGIEILPAN
jgi:Malectin domain